MFTLDNFHKSKEWENLVGQLRLERADEDGNVICAMCGQPITKKYDCIGHHKIVLTEDNVNDFTVSLNPDNIELIHHRCHNIIHQRYEGFRQEVWLVYGSPCVGKTTWVNSVAMPDDLIVDLDKIWEAICTSDRYHKPRRLAANAFGIRDFLIDQIRTRNGKWRNAYVIGTYPLRTDRDRLCDMLNAVPVYIDATQAECLARTNNPEWYDLVMQWWECYTA